MLHFHVKPYGELRPRDHFFQLVGLFEYTCMIYWATQGGRKKKNEWLAHLSLDDKGRFELNGTSKFHAELMRYFLDSLPAQRRVSVDTTSAEQRSFYERFGFRLHHHTGPVATLNYVVPRRTTSADSYTIQELEQEGRGYISKRFSSRLLRYVMPDGSKVRLKRRGNGEWRIL